MLPHEFIFSQNNLQFYVDCKQRFYLKEIAKLNWPANETEPVRLQEERMALGSRFHLLCSQYFCGVPAETLRESIGSPEMLHWWESFISLGLSPAPDTQPEKAITIPFAGYRLTAHYDLLVKQSDESYVIYDWKTNLKRPSRQQVQKRMQSIVYPLVLQLYLKQLKIKECQSPKIEMVYWYPEFPDQPHRFQYDLDTFKNQEKDLSELINQISQNSPNEFVRTDDLNQCLYCQFRSYCNRGESAGKYNEEMLSEE
jgi:hypothetical protein